MVINMSRDDAKIMVFLERIGIKKLSKEDSKALREFFSKRNLNLGLHELEVFYYINKSLLKTYETVSIENMMRVSKEIDLEMMLQFFAEFQELKSKSLDEKEFMKEFRKFAKKIYYRNTKTTKEIKSVVEEEMSKLESIKHVLYLGIGDEKVADQLFDNCVKRSKLFLDMCDADNLSDLLQYLKNNVKLTNNEMLDISSRCATFFSNSSAKKMMELKSTLDSLKKYIKKNLTVDNKESNVNKSFKDIVLSTPSFFVSNYEVVNNTVKFLQGARLGDLIENIPEELVDVTGDFNVEDVLDIFDNSITSLAISVDKIASVSMNVSKAYKSVFEKDLPLQGFINANNFNSIAQLTNDDFDVNGKIKEIFALLKPFLDAEGMEVLLKKDLSFLIASSEEVKNSLKSAIFNSKNTDEVKYNVMKKIKNHFDHYDSGYYVPSSSAKKTNNHKKRKTQIKELNKDDLDTFLSNIDADESEIKEWQEKWNEERAYKQLEAQIELEDILEGIAYLESETKHVRFKSIEDIDEQREMFHSMLEEAVLKKDAVFARCIANDEMNELNEKINLADKKARDNFDFNIDKFLVEFESRIKSINDSMAELNNQKSVIHDHIKKAEEMKNRLVELGIDEDKLAIEKEEIDALETILDAYSKTNAKADKLYQKSMELIPKFHESFVESFDLFHSPLKLEANRFQDSGYVLYLLTYIMIQDGYVRPAVLEGIDFQLNKEDVTMSINELKANLSPKQQALVDEIYTSTKVYDETSKDSFSELLAAADVFEVNTDSTNTYEGVERLLKKKLKAMTTEYNNRKDLFGRKEKYENAIDWNRLEEIKGEIEKLNESIEENLMAIETIKAKKLNKRK